MSVAYPEIRRELGDFMGFGRDPDAWSQSQENDIESVLWHGLQLFYHPPPLPADLVRKGIDAVRHQWSFLNPEAELVLTVGESEYELPSNFGHISGAFTYEPGYPYDPVTQVDRGRIRDLHGRRDYSGVPRFYAVYPKESEGTGSQRYKVRFWPRPNAAYELDYSYSVVPEKLTQSNPYPLGGPAHARTFRTACLAEAERFRDGQYGTHRQSFFEALVASIEIDRNHGPDFYGYNADRSDVRAAHRSPRRPPGRVAWDGTIY